MTGAGQGFLRLQGGFFHIKAVEKGPTLAEVCYALSPLFETYKIMSVEPYGLSYCWRARITNSEPWATVEEMSCPPVSCAKANRLNKPGAPSLYAAETPETALLEIQAKVGDIAQLIAFRDMPEKHLRFGIIGELHHIWKRGALRILSDAAAAKAVSKLLNDMPGEKALEMVYVDTFLDQVLASAELISAVGNALRRGLAPLVVVNLYVVFDIQTNKAH